MLKFFSFCAKKWRLLLCSDLRLQLRLLSSRSLLHRPIGFPRLLFIIISLHHRFCIFFDSAFLFLNFVDFFFFWFGYVVFLNGNVILFRRLVAEKIFRNERNHFFIIISNFITQAPQLHHSNMSLIRFFDHIFLYSNQSLI